MRSLLRRLISSATPAGVIYQCPCGEYYDPSKSEEAVPHFAHQPMF